MTPVRLAAEAGAARVSLRGMRNGAMILLALAMLAVAPAGADAASAKSAARAAPAARPVLPFVEDYAKALHDARARGIPIFIEAWAPW